VRDETPARDLLDSLQRRFPTFVPDGRVRRGRKTELIYGRVGICRAVAKHLTHRDPVWRWYLEREAALYEALASHPPPVRFPRFFGWAPDVAALLIEELEGEPLGRRRVDEELSERIVQALLALPGRLSDWRFSFSEPTAPPPEIAQALRRRLLEDPTHARWIVDGRTQLRDQAIVTPSEAERLAPLLAECPPVPSHGDLLPRNILHHGEAMALVDWECGGLHPQHWDAGLLWAGIPQLRGALEAQAGSELARFLATAVFALGREQLIALMVSRRPVAPDTHREWRGEIEAAFGRIPPAR